MWRILGELRELSATEPFRIWLIGSRLEAAKQFSDIDVLLSFRPGRVANERMIESALWNCRYYGLYQAQPRCVIDACFRDEGPTIDVTPLRPDTILQTYKLYSPKIAQLAMGARISRYRLFGQFSIEYLRAASETNFYERLPRRAVDGSVWPYLRPAIELI